MEIFYPPVGFHFKVEFQDLDKEDIDVRFQSINGLTVDMQTQSVKEGGEHRFEHVLPIRTKYTNLTLKRGLTKNSKLIEWCTDAFKTLLIYPKDVLVYLLNEEHEPLMTWNIVQAWPKKWSVSDFNAEKGGLVIETLELEYQYFTIEQ
ncbi:glycerol acyltransferase [Aquimarina atlantica]|uniref:Glycerol acyltransferase n=1 Tax=Aquimarina atlantica TaxID=1317122 RepID=A0A023BQ64_9FLAO|nr:phage tail protein [Aquimarina atlantica]EZH71843.1 glycerol acyltransferase [Aquimarina atlantica]